MKLLFGNPIGILSVITVTVSIGIVVVISIMLIRRSGGKHDH